MTEFGAAESLGVQRAGLFQFERRFARDGQRRTAADRDQTVRAAPKAQAPRSSRAAPPRRAGPATGRRLRHCRRRRSSVQSSAAKPSSEATKVFVAATLRSGPAAIGRTSSRARCQRTVGIVDDRCRHGAGGARRGGRFNEIVARSGLRNGQEQLILELKLAMIDGGDIGRCGRHWNAEMLLDQMLGERRRMGGAASGTGDDDDWRPATKPATSSASGAAGCRPAAARRRRLAQFSGHAGARRPSPGTVFGRADYHATCASDCAAERAR